MKMKKERKLKVEINVTKCTKKNHNCRIHKYNIRKGVAPS